MASQTQLPTSKKPTNPGVKKSVPGPGVDRSGSKMRWPMRIALLILLLMSLVYLSGRLVEPVRVRLATAPLVGRLFAKPVWAVLWNKPATDGTTTATDDGSKNEGKTTDPAANAGKGDSEAAARLAAIEAKESTLAKWEADLKLRENALKARESTISAQEVRLGQEIKVTEEMRARLEGQIRAEKDRVEVIRSMKASAVQALMGAMTDEEIIRILMYMQAEEVGKYLSGMEPYRSARLLQALKQVSADKGS